MSDGICKQLDKAEMLDWLRLHIDEAEKCVIILGVPDSSGGLHMMGIQSGLKYAYELGGFMDAARDVFMNEAYGDT
jgi:hypothetical protein